MIIKCQICGSEIGEEETQYFPFCSQSCLESRVNKILDSIQKLQKGPGKKVTYRINDRGCFICTSHHNDDNAYSKIRINGKIVQLHRLVYALCFGDIPEGYVVDHMCCNKKCFNPSHLRAVSVTENNRHTKLEIRAKLLNGRVSFDHKGFKIEYPNPFFPV